MGEVLAHRAHVLTGVLHDAGLDRLVGLLVVNGVGDDLIDGRRVLRRLGSLVRAPILVDVGGDGAGVAGAAGKHVNDAPAVAFELGVHHIEAGNERHRIFDASVRKRLQVRRELPGVATADGGWRPQFGMDAVAPKKDAERGGQRRARGERGAVVVAHGFEDRQPHGDTDPRQHTAQRESARDPEFFEHFHVTGSRPGVRGQNGRHRSQRSRQRARATRNCARRATESGCRFGSRPPHRPRDRSRHDRSCASCS